MAGLPEIIDDLRRRVSELERRIRSQSRTGVVTEVDAGNGIARVRLQEGDQPFLTGWIPWEEPAAGSNKTHNPPSVGQQVKIYSESGDLHDASIQGSLNSDANGRPSGAGDEYVMASVGAASVILSAGGASMVLKVGASTITMTDGGIVLRAPRVDLN
ncbi:phage baseplate assembly protein V [Antarcticimicrobium sediminis]|uniref:Phage baseplate assembly protein V n=1 Tax=Antarcticimicrobium sediminis TaxID=2546227 RepID=A0A4R5EI95_9RHOB|nr:phage baseplate assembly protein V [Antarcticimicrobium sediminis]TDE34128.1 phage baseplate assembly protein V [Antarcticimicrobium sediminis]